MYSFFLAFFQLDSSSSPCFTSISVIATTGATEELAQFLPTLPLCGLVQDLKYKYLSPLKVRDSATKVSCDLNMRNRMGVLNTAYIRFCASFDDRARDLMMVVKAFCKRHQLTDHGGDHLNNYSLVGSTCIDMES